MFTARRVPCYILAIFIAFEIIFGIFMYVEAERHKAMAAGFDAGFRKATEEMTDDVSELQSRIDQLTAEIEELKKKPEPVVVRETNQCSLSDEEINMIAQITMAEAGNQSELGQRLVIDVVLNRMDHWAFPDTVQEVIYQKNQFTPIWDGNFNRCYPREDLVQLVEEEMNSRTNSEVVFFRTRHYSAYGVPAFREGNHYFSSYS